MVLSTWQELSNVDFLIEIGKKTPIMESYDVRNRWRRKKL
jgi:hypothetical protein